jgi:hypothetical protein
VTEELPPARLPLVDNISETFDKLPPINLFRGSERQNAVPCLHSIHVPVVTPLELDGRIERLVVLYVGKLSELYLHLAAECGRGEEPRRHPGRDDALQRSDTKANCFSDAQKAAFRFAEEAFRLIEVSEHVYAEATRYFSPQAITELLYVVGTYMLLARVARTGRVPLDETTAAATSLK